MAMRISQKISHRVGISTADGQIQEQSETRRSRSRERGERERGERREAEVREYEMES